MSVGISQMSVGRSQMSARKNTTAAAGANFTTEAEFLIPSNIDVTGRNMQQVPKYVFNKTNQSELNSSSGRDLLEATDSSVTSHSLEPIP